MKRFLILSSLLLFSVFSVGCEDMTDENGLQMETGSFMAKPESKPSQVLPRAGVIHGISLSETAVNERRKGQVVGTVTVVADSDVNITTITVDDSRFEVVSNQLKLKNDIYVDYRVASFIPVQVTAEDAALGVQYTEMFNLQVTSVLTDNIKIAGMRSSSYGAIPWPNQENWEGAMHNLASYFPGSEPTAVWIVSTVTGNPSGYSIVEFPSDGQPHEYMQFAAEDKHEAYLDYFDQVGIKVYLQVESGQSNMDENIDLVLSRYSHHPCVVGVGIDWEWHGAWDTDTINSTVQMTDAQAQRWNDKVKSYNPEYRIFAKHWLAELMPPTYRGDMIFVDDSQGFSDLNAMVNEFANWADWFPDNTVLYQIGYGYHPMGWDDHDWWGNYATPPKDLGTAIASRVAGQNPAQEVGIVWVDFTMHYDELELVDNHWLIVDADPDTPFGQVTGEDIYPDGQAVEISATADSGYRFVKWQVVYGNPVISDVNAAQTTVTVVDRAMVSAVFQMENAWTINATADPNGTIKPAGSVSVSEHADQTFTIEPALGAALTDVVVDGESMGPVSSYTFENVTEEHSIHAVFASGNAIIAADFEGDTDGFSYQDDLFRNTDQAYYASGSHDGEKLKVALGGINGYDIYGMSGGWIADFRVDSVQAVTLSFDYNLDMGADYESDEYGEALVAMDGILYGENGNDYVNRLVGDGGGGPVIETGWQHFSVELGALEAGAHQLMVGGYSNKKTYTNEETVVFIDNVVLEITGTTHTISATADVNGTVSPSGTVAVLEGADQSFAITPEPGYQVSTVLVDGVDQGALTSYTFDNVTQAHTLHATFSALPTFTISAAAGSNGTISPAGDVLVPEGSAQGFTITPDLGFEIDDVLVNGQSKGPVASFTFDNVVADNTIEAVFKPVLFTLTATAGANGSISPAGETTVTYGDSQTFNIDAAAGYRVMDVTIDGSSIGAVDAYTFDNITQDHTIDAAFEIIPPVYTIVASAGPNGSISPAGSVEVDEGEDVTFTILADDNFEIEDVTVDGVSQGAISSYTFENIGAEHIIEAFFKEQSGSICDGIQDWDASQNWTEYSTGDQRVNDNRLWECTNIGYSYFEPSGPWGHYGWRLVNPC